MFTASSASVKIYHEELGACYGGWVSSPNTLIFVDFPAPDPEAAGDFYAEVFGWVVEPRPAGVFPRIVPGGQFPAGRTWTNGSPA